LSKYNGYKSVIAKAKESNFIILAPMIILSILTVFSGFMFKDIFIGKGSTFFKNSIFIHKDNFLDSDFLPTSIKLIPIILSLIIIVLALHIPTYDYLLVKWQSTRFRNIHQFFYNRYHIDTIYNYIAQ